MALLGAYKPKYETTFSGIAKQAPISSVVSLGLVPAIGSLVGKGLEVGRAMFSDTGDPMAMVKDRTQQVAGELSDYTNGKAGKLTVAKPIAPVAASAAPAKQAGVADIGTTFGNVGLTKMGPADLSKMSNGTMPPRRAPVRNTPAQQNISSPDEEGLRTPDAVDIAAPAQQLPSGQRIFDMSGADAAGMAKADIASNGGFATMDGRTLVLPSRGVDEEAAFRAQQAQAQNAQPIAAITQPTQQTSTVGYGNGIETYGGDGSLISSTRKLGSNATLGDMMMEKFNTNQQVKQAGIANINSEMNRRTDLTQLEKDLQPSQINQNNASARHANIAAELGLIKAPAEIDNIKAVTAQHNALTKETNTLIDLKGRKMISDIDYQKGMLDIGNNKLGLLTKQYDMRIAQMKQSKDTPDYKLIADIAKNKMKTYQEMGTLGTLTPEQKLDIQKQNDILNLVQRHATKSSSQYGGSATSITDDEN